MRGTYTAATQSAAPAVASSLRTDPVRAKVLPAYADRRAISRSVASWKMTYAGTPFTGHCGTPGAQC